MSWMAVAVVGGSVVGGLIQGDAATTAGDQAARSANKATDAQLQMFNTTNNQAAPWRQAGQNALNLIGTGFGNDPQMGVSGGGFDQVGYDAAMSKYNAQPQGTTWTTDSDGNPHPDFYPVQPAPSRDQFNQPQTFSASTPQAGPIGQGQFTHQFAPEDLKSNLAPNYAWQLGQGLGALQNSQAGTSGLVSGNAMRGINDYAQNFAGNSYQNAFNNWNTQQSNIFNRLSTIAGMGNASAMNSGNVGAQTGAGMANSMISGGQAQAAGTVGMGNALSGGINNGIGSWYGMKLLGNQSGSNPIPYLNPPNAGQFDFMGG